MELPCRSPFDANANSFRFTSPRPVDRPARPSAPATASRRNASSPPASPAASRVPLSLCVSLRRGEVLAQLVRRAARTIARRVALDAPSLLQRTRVQGFEPELVDQ